MGGSVEGGRVLGGRVLGGPVVGDAPHAGQARVRADAGRPHVLPEEARGVSAPPGISRAAGAPHVFVAPYVLVVRVRQAG